MSHWDSLPFGLGQFMKLGRDVNLLVLAGGAVSIPYGYFTVIQTIYLSTVGIDDGTIGIILSLSTLTMALMTIPFGILADRYSRKWVLIAGGVLSALAWIPYAALVNVGAFYVASILVGLGSATFSAQTALIAERTKNEERTVAFSLSFFAYMAGSTIGALACGIPDFLMKGYGLSAMAAYQPLFLAGFVFGLLTSALVLPVREGASTKREVKIIPTKSRKEIVQLSVANAFVALGAGFIIPLLPLWLFLKFQVGGGGLGTLNVITNFLMALSYLMAPELVRRLGHVGSIVSVQLLATAMLVAMPLMPSYGIVAVLYILRSFLMNLGGPINSAFMANVVHPDELASAAAICSPFSGVTWGLPNAVGQGIGGFMFKANMFDEPFYICGALYAVATLLFYAFFRNWDQHRAENNRSNNGSVLETGKSY
ncbi:MAG TPA: MFS transporter [Thermoproteota archaeon]|nr:MFS transporter [Thermoproteota archaeon]